MCMKLGCVIDDVKASERIRSGSNGEEDEEKKGLSLIGNVKMCGVGEIMHMAKVGGYGASSNSRIV